MSDSANYKQKYLETLEEQELLQHLLAKLSLAAQGNDQELDELLGGLRKSLRQGSVQKSQLEKLDNSLRGYDKRREESSKRIAAKLDSYLGQKLDKHPPEDQKQKIKQLKKNLQTLNQHSDQWLELFVELLDDSEISAEGNSQSSGGGFWKRFFLGGSQPSTSQGASRAEHGAEDVLDPRSDSITVEKEIQEDSAGDATGSPVEQNEPVVSNLEGSSVANSSSTGFAEVDAAPLEGQFQSRDEAEEQEEFEAILQRPVHEPAFSRISDKVETILTDLLNHVETGESVAHKAIAVRMRMAKGLNWFELVPTLEDIRDLVMQAYLAADNEYRAYLKEVEQSLSGIVQATGLVLKQVNQDQKVEEEFQVELSRQLGSLSQNVEVAVEVEALKDCVQEHLQNIKLAIEKRESRKNIVDVKLLEKLSEVQQELDHARKSAMEAKRELEVQRKKALTDTLTGLPNREAYNTRVYEEFVRWQRYGRPLSFALCDIDYFKKINDQYGHSTGDKVLKVLANSLKKRMRAADFVARVGGEEFVLLMPETNAEDALQFLEKVREKLANTAFRYRDAPLPITVSIGITQFASDDAIDKVFQRADKALYQAKNEGRNCCRVVSYESEQKD